MNESYTVGDGVEMQFKNGMVKLYSNGGTLWPDWPEKTGIKRSDIISVRVAEGTVFLPEDAGGFNLEEWHYTMFGGLSNARLIDMRGFDTSMVTNMHRMFTNCSKLRSLHLDSLNTSNVTDMGYMFAECDSLTTLDLNSFDTSRVTDMAGMFRHCKNLKTVIMNPAVNQGTRTGRMFDDCQAEIIYI